MKQIEHTTLSKPIYDSLKQMILTKKLNPGEKILQERIAEQLGVSRTPLMKALQTLEHELLVESIPRRGRFVREMSIKEMIDIYYCREGIECLATRLATERSSKKELENLQGIFRKFEKNPDSINSGTYQIADEEFHNSIIELSNNTVLQKMSQMSQVSSKVYSLGLLRKPSETLHEHKNIINAMLLGDAKKAEFEMSEHIRLSREVLSKLE